MFVLDDDCVFVDVDFTLILPQDIELLIPDSANKKLVAKIREWKDKGRTIVVWTSNGDGVAHAIKAIDLCGIREDVDYVMPKPRTIVDDDHLEYYNIIDPITLKLRSRS